MRINPLKAIDFYKADHRLQYPEGTTQVYSNFTPRSSHLAPKLRDRNSKHVVFFGLQYFVYDFLVDAWNQNFFWKDRDEVVGEYRRVMDNSLGAGAVSVNHIYDLHKLGYLPISIKALPEGALVPIGVPVLTIVNTHPDFAWLTNYLESAMSCYLWKPITSATMAYQYKKLLRFYAEITGSVMDSVQWQAHDFSFRGMSGPYDAALSGAAHLTSFTGTDSVLAIDLLEKYYHARHQDGVIGGSIPATEHSVMSAGTNEDEFGTYRRLICDVYPKGFVSIVSDTWDFWRVLVHHLPMLKDRIMQRDGKVVIRPDSGDPVKIVCGDHDAPIGSPEYRGAVQLLWDVFGGTVTGNGYKMLDPHIGLIYGDSITLDRAHAILDRLRRQGFASGNVVFGVGSFTYQHVTRDTYGFAVKSTSCVVNGERRDIYKDPKTVSGISKKSARGLLRVEKADGDYVLFDQQTEDQECMGELEVVFQNGRMVRTTKLSEIRERIEATL